jgi:hypothetical protein
MAGHSFSELREQHEIDRIASRKTFISPTCFAMVIDLYCYEYTSNKICSALLLVIENTRSSFLSYWSAVRDLKLLL